MATKATPKKRGLPFSKWRPLFIDALREWGNVSHAAKIAGINRVTAYKQRERNESFASEWDDALEEATDALEMEARRRAERGVMRMKFYQGTPIMIPVFDDEGEPIYETVTDAQGKPVCDKDGNPKLQVSLVPYMEHEYSDTLIIFLLKAYRDKFKDKMDITSGGEKMDAPIYIVENRESTLPPD